MHDQHRFWLEILAKNTTEGKVDIKHLQEIFWQTARDKLQSLIPRVRIPWNEFSPIQITHQMDGLNWAMTETAFMEIFGQFKGAKFPWGHSGTVAIKFCYREEHVPATDETETRSDG